MNAQTHPANGSGHWSVAITGLIALALAMGIGRFAFTPVLPMMQIDAGLSLQQGSWLASANYAGYLLGALTVSRITLRPDRLVRIGLVLIVATTLGMGWTSNLPLWAGLRFVAGVASAWVLVSVAFWSLTRLQMARRSELGSVVFAGVGVGIAVVGLACMLLAGWSVSSAMTWSVLGAMSLILAGCIWSDFAADPVSPASGPEPQAAGLCMVVQRHWRLVVCYGVFGLGYILPATYLPALAREIVDDPRVFGLAWPLFGIAAAASTLLVSRYAQRLTRRELWFACQLVMAVGVVLPAVWVHPVAIALAALSVGGTFVVITMIALQEAGVVAGRDARVLMAAMTAAFAAGQVAGPLIVAVSGGVAAVLWLAAAALIVSAWLLRDSGALARSISSRRDS